MSLYFTKEHEWVRVEGDVATVGISDHAPRRRLDETLAARKPVLAYKTPAPDGSSTGLGAKYGGG